MPAASDLVVASAQIKGGRLWIHNRRAFDQQIATLRDGWEVEVAVKRLRATRSQQQNSYYWGVVVQMVAEYTGYTPDETHEVLKQHFIPKRLAVCDGNGEVKGEFVLGGSTREMNTIEFGEYMEAIRQWAAETFDLVIPDPNEDAPVPHVRCDVGSRSTWYRSKRRGSDAD